MTIAPAQRRDSSRTWLVPAGLILLTSIPIASGSLRLTQLAGGPQLIPAAARFSGSPVPVVLHVVAATVFCLLGAFQFLPALRRGTHRWHRYAGRVVLPAGFVVAASGLWMATISPHPIGDGVVLMVIRVVFGSYMLISLVLAIRALVHRQYGVHGSWMTRAYAIGIGAGTQALALIPGAIVFGPNDQTSRAVAMGGAWVLNLAIAELVIHRRAVRTDAARMTVVAA